MKLLLLILIALPTFSFSAEFTSMSFKPNVLELKKYRPVSGKLELRFIHESPRIVIRTGYNTKEMHDFISKVINSDLSKINCDGDFFLMYDNFGNQIMHINSIKTCVDEEGDVVAHSIGIQPLNAAQIAASSKFIADNMKPVTSSLPVIVNDSTKPKEVINPMAGVFSPKLNPKSTQK